MTLPAVIRRRPSFAGLLLAAGALIPAARAQTAPAHKLVLHIDRGDEAVMTLALGNLANALDFYAERSQPLALELVANGPGYNMLRDTSPVRASIADIRKQHPAIVLSACQNSRRAIAQHEGKRPEQIIELPGITDVPAGVARLVELQEQGWSYIKV